MNQQNAPIETGAPDQAATAKPQPFIKPEIGRSLWYWPTGREAGGGVMAQNADQPMCATICFVHNVRRVNLRVIDHEGRAHAMCNVELRHGQKGHSYAGFADWMPHQVEQEAKAQDRRDFQNAVKIVRNVRLEMECSEQEARHVEPAGVEAHIASEHYFTAREGAEAHDDPDGIGGLYDYPKALDLLQICVLVLHNGRTVVGASACLMPEELDAETARKMSREMAVWQLREMLKEQLCESVV